MKRLIFFLLPINVFAQFSSGNYDSLQQRIQSNNDSIYVVNFWATWCAPCVEELPYFEKLNKTHSGEKVKVLLINLDFNSRVETVAKPFVTKKNIQSEVYHITDTDPNLWINRVDSSWSGAIPATVIYHQSKKVFFKEGGMNEEELLNTIKIIKK